MKAMRSVIATIIFGLFLSSCRSSTLALPPPIPNSGPLSSAEAYLARGDYYSNLKDYTYAIADYSNAIALRPDFAEAFNNPGLAYSLKSKSELSKAIADYSQAIQLRPAYANTYNNRGVAYMASGHPQQALSDFNHAIELKPGFPQAHSNRGNYYWWSGHYALAMIDLWQAHILLFTFLILLIWLPVIAILIWIVIRGSRSRHSAVQLNSLE